MQIINLEADISTPHLEVEMRTLRIGSGGTDNYPDLNNKPSINGTTLVGDILTANLGIKTSELTNDSGYITTADIPTKTSDLINDSDFTTGSALTAAIAAVSADIPTTTSQLTNDSGFLTSIDIPSVPTKTSDLINDSGYITAAQAPVTTVNGLTGDVVINAANTDYDISNTIKDKIDSLEAAIPTDTNNLTNGAGFITAAEAPVQSVNSQTGDVTITVPTDTNDLTNGAGFITAAEAPVQTVNGQTGTVILDASDIEVSSGVTIADNLSALASYIPQTATITNTSIASFSDGSDNVPVSELIVGIEPVQASGTPTPSSPIPITGHTDVNATVTGKNIIDYKTVWSSFLSGDELINPLATTKYYFPSSVVGREVTVSVDVKANSTTANCRITCNINGTNTNSELVNTTGTFTNTSVTVTPTSTSDYLLVTSSGPNGTYKNMQLELGSTATTYEAYNGTTDTIALGQTVYGGELNVTTGELTITMGNIASYNGESINEPWLSSYDEYVPGTTPTTGAQVVYTLSTPTTTTLTPTEVATVLGYNNIYGDTGDIIKLVYFKTGCEAIARLIEAYK